MQVSPRDSPHLLLVLLRRVHGPRQVVCRHELLRPQSDVYLLLPQGLKVSLVSEVKYPSNLLVRVRVPKCVAMVITSCQLIQMVVGCLVNYTAYTFKTKGKSSVFDHQTLLSLTATELETIDCGMSPEP